MNNKPWRTLGLAFLVAAPMTAAAQITTAPNPAAQGTAVPPSAFPNPTNPTTPPSAFPPGSAAAPQQGQWPDPLAPQRQSWQMQAPAASSSAVQPTLPSTTDQRTLTPSSTPTCNSVQANGLPCVQQY